MIKASFAMVGISFLLVLIFLLFCYVKSYIEDRFNITGYKMIKSRLTRELNELQQSSGSEFPIVDEVCEYFLNRIKEDFNSDSRIHELQMELSNRYGDDSK